MRRPLALAVVASSLLAGACGGGGAGRALDSTSFEAARFVPELRLGYFPVGTGLVWTYEGDQNGVPSAEDVRTVATGRAILGVQCTGIEESYYVDGILSGRSTEWYAQDTNGNVWRFGEEASSFLGNVEFPSPDSWIASMSAIRPWISFPAIPRVGERFVGRRPNAIEVYLVSSTDRTVVTSAGTFTGCTELVENPDNSEDADIILFAPGVGRVSESSVASRSRLVGFSR